MRGHQFTKAYENKHIHTHSLLLHRTKRIPALRRTDNCNSNNNKKYIHTYSYMGKRHVNSRVCPITVEVVLVILILLLMNSVCLKCYECLDIALLCSCCTFCCFFYFLAFQCNNVARMNSTHMQLYLHIHTYAHKYMYVCLCALPCTYFHLSLFTI